jgi:MFS family permease
LSRAIELLRHERRARLFFAALTQSALGNGAAYIALIVVAYDRLESAWGIGLVLFADLLPSMLLSPVFGAAADRWSRRTCMIVSDVVRAGAFIGIALVDSFVPTLAFAILAGTGAGLFTPAALSALPSLVSEERRPAATAIFGAVADLGFIAGPGLAAALFLVIPPDTILLANGVTFAISAAALMTLRFGAAPVSEDEDEAPASILRETRDGFAALRRMVGIRIVIVGSGTLLFFAGLINVAELPFVTDALDRGDATFALLNVFYGLGFISGSLSGAKGGDTAYLRRWWLIGLAVMGVGMVSSGVSPGVVVAALAFGLTGLGNGLLLVFERLLIQAVVPDRLMGRVFGIKDGLTAWTFAAAFLAGGGLVEAFGPRAVLVFAGAGGLVVWIGSRIALRRASTLGLEAEPVRPTSTGRFRSLGGAVGEDGADAVGSGDGGGALLDRTH